MAFVSAGLSVNTVEGIIDGLCRESLGLKETKAFIINRDKLFFILLFQLRHYNILKRTNREVISVSLSVRCCKSTCFLCIYFYVSVVEQLKAFYCLSGSDHYHTDTKGLKSVTFVIMELLFSS